MKTLDEVIKKYEWCNDEKNSCSACHYNLERCACDPDALHYLKEYRSILVQAAERCHKRVMDEFINGSQGEKK